MYCIRMHSSSIGMFQTFQTIWSDFIFRRNPTADPHSTRSVIYWHTSAATESRRSVVRFADAAMFFRIAYSRTDSQSVDQKKWKHALLHQNRRDHRHPVASV